MKEVGSQPTENQQARKFSNEHHDAHDSVSIGDHSVHHMGGGDQRSSIHVGASVEHEDLLTWESSEFIFHERSALWYVGFSSVTIAIAAIFFFVLNGIWAPSMVIFMGGVVIAFSRRRPELRRYTISTDGVSVGEEHFDFDEFTSFTIIEENGIYSIALNRVNRFMPPVSMYIADDVAEQIVGLLSEFLPHDEKNQTIVDQALTRLRF